MRRKQTQSAKSEIVPEIETPTEGDLMAWLEESLEQYAQQPGEYSREELLAKAGSEYKLKLFLDAHKGHIVKRRLGQKMLYRLTE